MGGWGDDDREEDPRLVLAADNQRRLYLHVVALIEASQQGPAEVTSATICDLHRTAMAGLIESAGMLRIDDVVVASRYGAVVFHEPPPFDRVPVLLDEACVYINQGIVQTPLHTAAYALWRLNWIHPFVDGNGRTARALAYLLLGVGFGSVLPGSVTIPQLIQFRKFDYQDALVAADRAWKAGTLDVMAMEVFLAELLEKQLAGS